MGKLTEGAAYAITQIWRDANYLHKKGYTDAAATLSQSAWDLCGGSVEGLCPGCGRPVAATATVEHHPWCATSGAGWYDPTEELREARELAALAALWDEPDTPDIFGTPGKRPRAKGSAE